MIYIITILVRGAIIFFFYFFFDELYYVEDIQQAFKNICLDKMLSDGYFDMSIYIYGRIKKEDMYAKLRACKSKFAELYRGPYPKKDNAMATWKKCMGEDIYADGSNCFRSNLTHEESKAIVNWVYRTLKNMKERETFTEELLRQIKEFNNISQSVCLTRGVVYNKKKIELNFIASVSDVNRFISLLGQRTNTLFFRGHSDPNYILQPSIMRSSSLRQNESKIYQELLINCPDDFEKCHSHLEKLVKMQHYGLPTRLLDITRNPLVALYFACEGNLDTYGELVLISAENHEIKYPQSDTASILASLPTFTVEDQREFYRLANDPEIGGLEFERGTSKLIQEVRLEKPSFQSSIKREDILNSYIVFALKNNNRIVKQDGAFILCGLNGEVNSLEEFRYREQGKKIVLLIEKKEKILEQLESFSINRATLFPEIECVAEYLKKKYG